MSLNRFEFRKYIDVLLIFLFCFVIFSYITIFLGGDTIKHIDQIIITNKGHSSYLLIFCFILLKYFKYFSIKYNYFYNLDNTIIFIKIFFVQKIFSK